jgi:hypothetical protein
MKRRHLIAMAGGGALQAGAVLLLLGGSSLGLIAGVHLAGAVAWGWGQAPRFFYPPRVAWSFASCCAAIFPLLGPVASLVLEAQLRQPPVDRSSRRYTVWDDEAAGEIAEAPKATVTGQSIVEILQSPRSELRRNAVLALRELDPRMAIPLLRKGLQDSDEQVRIYAQNILSTMLERFEAGIKELEQRLDAEPNAWGHAIRLAAQYFELVYLDVAGDEETASRYLTWAQTLLQRADAAAPGDAEVAFQGLRYALRAHDVGQARKWFARLDTSGYDARQVLPWEMELVFIEGDWPALHRLFDEFHRSEIVNPRVEEVIAFWRGTETRSA